MIFRPLAALVLCTVAAFHPMQRWHRRLANRRLAQESLRASLRSSVRVSLFGAPPPRGSLLLRAAEADDADAAVAEAAADTAADTAADADAAAVAAAVAEPPKQVKPKPKGRKSLAERSLRTAANPITWKNGLYAGSLAIAVALPVGLLLLAQK